LDNYQYVEYKSNEPNSYIECSFEEAYLITDEGFGYAYVKLLNHYLPLEELKESVDLMLFVELIGTSTSIKFYKEKFARPFNCMDTLEEGNLVILLNCNYINELLFN